MGGSVLPGHQLYVPWKNGTPGASGIRSTRCQITSGRDRVDTLKPQERRTPRWHFSRDCHLPDLVVFEVPGLISKRGNRPRFMFFPDGAGHSEFCHLIVFPQQERPNHAFTVCFYFACLLFLGDFICILLDVRA